MEASPEIRPVAQAGLSLAARPAWDARVARWVSSVINPPVMGVMALALVGELSGSSLAWSWAASYLLLTVAVPMLYIGWLVWRGRATDLELVRREQRTRPFIVTLACLAAGWGLLRWGHAPALMVALAAASTTQAALLLAITLRWKVSIHAVSIGALAVLILAAWGFLAAPILLLVPLVGWSRVRLRRHTTAQVLAGVVLGMASMWVALRLAA